MKEKIKAIIKKHETKTKDVYIDKGIDANHYDEFIADLAKLFVIGVVSNNEVAVCSQCGKDKYLHPLIADEGLCICNVKQTDC